jgi:hypothetical protein
MFATREVRRLLADFTGGQVSGAFGDDDHGRTAMNAGGRR